MARKGRREVEDAQKVALVHEGDHRLAVELVVIIEFDKTALDFYP